MQLPRRCVKFVRAHSWKMDANLPGGFRGTCTCIIYIYICILYIYVFLIYIYESMRFMNVSHLYIYIYILYIYIYIYIYMYYMKRSCNLQTNTVACKPGKWNGFTVQMLWFIYRNRPPVCASLLPTGTVTPTQYCMQRNDQKNRLIRFRLVLSHNGVHLRM